MQVTRNELAEICKRTVRTVANWIDAGMPCSRHGKRYAIELEQAIPWLLDQQPSAAQPGSERDRLAKEQADKVAIENAKSRDELVLVDHVREVWTAAEAALASQHDGVAGRLANDVAGETDPAICRQILLDEHRRIRAAYSVALEKLFESPAAGPAVKADSKPAAKKKRKPVGRRKQSPSTRKR